PLIKPGLGPGRQERRSKNEMPTRRTAFTISCNCTTSLHTAAEGSDAMALRGGFGGFDNTGALLSTVLDQTHDCIKLLGRDGTIQYVNERGAIAMELRTPSELQGLKWIERWPDEARPTAARALEEARSGSVARFTGSRIIGGRPTWWDVTVAPVQSAEAAEYLLVVARDMTAEVQQRERAEAVSAEMRHRLRNAMAIASALVHLSARDKPEAQTFANEVAFRFSQLGRIQELVLDPSLKKSLKRVV